MSVKTSTPVQPLHEIANIIKKDWKQVNFAAKPYLDAMSQLEKVSDQYGMDSGKSIVAYFLANAGQWKGDVARETKKTLNKMIK
jgi:hypothetical protein